jgi:galactokinase
VPRSLRSSKYNDRRAECDEALAIQRRTNPSLHALAHASVEEVRAAGLPAVLEKRALHVVTETRRVRETVRILQQTGKLPGELMLASHESLRDLYECSSPELDWFVERAMQSPGITGARLTGAGWGGCAIAAGSRVALESAAPAIAKDYERAFGRTPRTWITTAKNGASVDSIA